MEKENIEYDIGLMRLEIIEKLIDIYKIGTGKNNIDGMIGFINASLPLLFEKNKHPAFDIPKEFIKDFLGKMTIFK